MTGARWPFIALLIICAAIALALGGFERQVVKAQKEAAARCALVPMVEPLPPKPAPPVFIGETITYDVKMGMFTIGTCVFTHSDRVALFGKDVDLFTFVTKGPSFFDKETIYGDPGSFLPVRVERDISIWPKKEKITEEYDQKANTVTITKNGASQVIRKAAPLNNAILLPFVVRKTAKLENGWSMKAVLPTQEFEIRLARAEKVTVPSGSYDTYYFESTPPKFQIWITADERRIPVKIRGTGGLGYTMLMSGYEGPREKKKE